MPLKNIPDKQCLNTQQLCGLLKNCGNQLAISSWQEENDTLNQWYTSGVQLVRRIRG